MTVKKRGVGRWDGGGERVVRGSHRSRRRLGFAPSAREGRAPPLGKQFYPARFPLYLQCLTGVTGHLFKGLGPVRSDSQRCWLSATPFFVRG